MINMDLKALGSNPDSYLKTLWSHRGLISLSVKWVIHKVKTLEHVGGKVKDYGRFRRHPASPKWDGMCACPAAHIYSRESLAYGNGRHQGKNKVECNEYGPWEAMVPKKKSKKLDIPRATCRDFRTVLTCKAGKQPETHGETYTNKENGSDLNVQQ